MLEDIRNAIKLVNSIVNEQVKLDPIKEETPEVTKMLLKQVALEWYAMASYRQFASIFRSKGMTSTYKWLVQQSNDEHGHGLKVVEFLEDRGVSIEIPPIEAPPYMDDVRDIAEVILAMEGNVTSKLTAIKEQANKDEDELTDSFISGMLTEQIEEEDSSRVFLSYFENSKDILVIDQQVKENLLAK